jgi:hypothetical protein
MQWLAEPWIRKDCCCLADASSATIWPSSLATAERKASMLCSNCGATIPDGSTTCPNCQAAVAGASATATATATAPPPPSGATAASAGAKAYLDYARDAGLQAWRSLRQLAVNPVGGLDPAYKSLGDMGAMRVGIVFGIVSVICFLLGG